MNASLTTQQAAERLGVTVSRVRQLVLEGRLPAEKFGRDLAIHEDDLKLVANRKPGRPPNQATNMRKGARVKGKR